MGSTMKETLLRLGWMVFEHSLPLQHLEPKSTVLVLDELSSPVMAEIRGRDDQWLGIQRLVNLDCKILWVTSGSQLEVKNPNSVLIHGLSRVVRGENPSLVFLTLDIESGSSASSLTAIDILLKTTQLAKPKTQVENEFVERRGIIHVSRVLPDDPINQAENSDSSGGKLQVRSLHDANVCIRLQCERLGTMDSLQFSEVSENESLVPDDFVEIEIYAAGLNFKVSAHIVTAILHNVCALLPQFVHVAYLNCYKQMCSVGKTFSAQGVFYHRIACLNHICRNHYQPL